MTRAAVVALTLLGTAFSFPETSVASDIEVGEPFPKFALPSGSDGSPASVNQYLGQKILLHVFASW